MIDIFGPLKLRDHPLMSYLGGPNWPPVWIRKDRLEKVAGEVGVLIYVHSSPIISSKFFLVIEHNGDTYVGTLVFDNAAFCKQISGLLNLHLKRSIQAIGDLELPPP